MAPLESSSATFQSSSQRLKRRPLNYEKARAVVPFPAIKDFPESHLRNSSSSLRRLSRNISPMAKWFLKPIREGSMLLSGLRPWAWKLHSGSGRSKNRSKGFAVGPARSQLVGMGERRANPLASWAMGRKPIRQRCSLPENGLHQVRTRDRAVSNHARSFRRGSVRRGRKIQTKEKEIRRAAVRYRTYLSSVQFVK
jgi:hypothetical protein